MPGMGPDPMDVVSSFEELDRHRAIWPLRQHTIVLTATRDYNCQTIRGTIPCGPSRTLENKTFQSFRISTFGPQLIDPEGNLIKGDEAVLAEKLKKSER